MPKKVIFYTFLSVFCSAIIYLCFFSDNGRAGFKEVYDVIDKDDETNVHKAMEKEKKV